jgi:hypothetical protein
VAGCMHLLKRTLRPCNGATRWKHAATGQHTTMHPLPAWRPEIGGCGATGLCACNVSIWSVAPCTTMRTNVLRAGTTCSFSCMHN